MSDTPATSAEPPRRRPQTHEEYAAKFLTDAINNVAAHLRRAAEMVEDSARSVEKVASGKFTGTYGSVAAEALSAYRNGIANVHIERLAYEASDADIARAEAKAAGQ